MFYSKIAIKWKPYVPNLKLKWKKKQGSCEIFLFETLSLPGAIQTP